MRRAPRFIVGGVIGLAVALASGVLVGGADPPAATATPPATRPDEPLPAARFTPPAPPGASELAAARAAMVEHQIAAPRDGRTPVRDPHVLAAVRAVPRHVFVPAERRNRAYTDGPLPIGHGQTISQPYMVALMTELLAVTPASKVLEIGTGSGYQAAVLAHLTPYVYSIEIVKPLAERADRVLRAQGYDRIRRRHGDGYWGWPDAGPFDAIIVTCAAGHLPPPLWDQLAPGGRIVIPIGGPHEVQRLVVVTKDAEGKRSSRTVTAVRFVPLTRDGRDRGDR